MKCTLHPEREAVGICAECNNAVCSECKVEYRGQVFCNPCIEKKIIGTDATSTQPTLTAGDINTSGMGSKSVIPAGLGDWNWGGFLLTWIWGIGNNVWWSFLFFVPFLGPLVMPWVLAFKGNEWAWQSKRWESVEHFKRVQHTWAMWGIWVIIALSVLTLILFAIVVGLIVYGLQSSGFKWF
jgi:hypothetical protein